ncbi:MAG: zinc ribbon domain-containing protein [Blastocatellia bacterium]
MYCPNCGIECIEQRNFCNGCGTNIGVVKKTMYLAKNLSTDNLENLKQSFVLEKEWNSFLSKGLIFIGLGLLYSLTIFIVGFIIKKYFNDYVGRLLKDLSIFGTLFLLIGIMIISYGRIKLRSKNTNLAMTKLLLAESQNSNEPKAKELPSGEKDLNFNVYTPPSVIEHTTKELRQNRIK